MTTNSTDMIYTARVSNTSTDSCKHVTKKAKKNKKIAKNDKKKARLGLGDGDVAIKLICNPPLIKGKHSQTLTDKMDTPIDINKLKTFYASHNKVDANFHAWNVDSQGNIIDDYKDPNTECGRVLGLIMRLHGYTTLEYEPFKKKKCKQYNKLLNKYTTFADEYEPFKIYMEVGDHVNKVGRCLQRAWKANYFNNYNVVIGMVYMVNENGDRIAVEGDEVNDGWFCKKHLQLCMEAFMNSQIKLEEWRTAIYFFANNDELLKSLEPIVIQKKKIYLRQKLGLAMRRR
jgi:hypothetical protein